MKTSARVVMVAEFRAFLARLNVQHDSLRTNVLLKQNSVKRIKKKSYNLNLF
jgi:hypothetical protein